MKRLTVMWGVLIFAGFFNVAGAQPVSSSEHIFVTYAKTTHLIFPYPVQSVDHGSNGIMVQQRKGAGNILHVKAAKVAFEPTSLSVVTSDGQFYSFIVEYAQDVDDIHYVFTANEESDLQKVQDAPMFLSKRNANGQMSLALQGIYADSKTIWWKCTLRNTSLLDFPINYCKYFIRDRRRLKRRVMKERELLPNYFSGNELVGAKDHDILIAGFDGLHLKLNERFIIQMGDDSGKMVELKIPARLFNKARILK